MIVRKAILVAGTSALIWALCVAAQAAPGSVEVHVVGPAAVTLLSGDDIAGTATVAKGARGCLLRDVKPGACTVVASASGHASATQAVTVPDGGAAEVWLELTKLGADDYESLGRIVGFVKDTAGKPVTGAVLVLLRGDDAVGTARAQGPTGVYELEWYAPGTYVVVAQGTGHKRATLAGQTISAGASTRLDIELQPQ